jgi:tetratricopeptide (TPR) repeat protein
MRLFLCLPLSLLCFNCLAQVKGLKEIALEHVNSGKYLEAIEFIKETEKLDLDSAENLLAIKLFCQYKTKQHKAARQTLNLIEELDVFEPESEIIRFYYQAEENKDEQLAEESLEFLETDPQQFYRQLKILNKKDIDFIARKIRRYLDTLEQEEIPEYKTALAVIYFADSNLIECYNMLSNCVEDYPLGFSYYMLGIIKTQHREYISAISYFNQAEDANYKPLSLYRDRSIAKGFDKDFKGAIEDLDICISNEPSDELYYLRAVSYTNLMQYDKALIDINTALSMNDTIAKYHNQKGIIYTNTLNYVDAVISFQTAIQLNPNLKYINNNLGIALEKAGFKAKAFEYYKENIKKHPDHADSYFNLGRIAYEQSDYKQAIKLLQRANDLNPRYSDTQYLLGMAYIKSRNLSQGCFYLNMAKDNGNTSAESAISSYCEQKTEEETEE